MSEPAPDVLYKFFPRPAVQLIMFCCCGGGFAYWWLPLVFPAMTLVQRIVAVILCGVPAGVAWWFLYRYLTGTFGLQQLPKGED
jgi:hypothetical protein